MKTNRFVFLHRPGPNWLPEKTLLEQPLGGHFRYMTELEAAGSLRLGGGFLDNSGALAILRADDLDQARQIVQADPAVRDGVVTATVHPYYVTVAVAISSS